MDQASELRARIAEAAAWCANRIDPQAADWGLRSAELRPDSGFFDERRRDLTVESPMVDSVAQRRRELVLAGDQQRPESGNDSRVLLLLIQQSPVDGYTDSESRGFFDLGDNPPWDTWLSVLSLPGEEGECLAAWIPQSLTTICEHAMTINAFGALAWGDRAWTEQPWITSDASSRWPNIRLPAWFTDVVG